MRIETAITMALTVSALTLGVGAARADDFDTTMEAVLVDYLKIQEALAADKTEGIEDAVGAIQESAKKLGSEPAAGKHAEHYKSIRPDLLTACEKLHGARDIGSVRQAFKDLSKPVSMWVSMAKPENTSVMYCSMEEAVWVQRGSQVANPYVGAKMKSCGQKVGGSDL